MSLTPITKSRDFFDTCLSKTEIPPLLARGAIMQVEEALIGFQKKEDIEELLEKLIRKHPKLLSYATNSAGDTLVHRIAKTKHKSLIELCVRLSGQAILEVGNEFGETPLFRVSTFPLLREFTFWGAKVNVISGKYTVLENLAWKVRPWEPDYELRRCVKHLIGLGARLPIGRDVADSGLPSIYEQFLEEAAGVNAKIREVMECIKVKDLCHIVFRYVYEEEGSQTPVYGPEGEYLLDDEAGIYHDFILKTNPASTAL